MIGIIITLISRAVAFIPLIGGIVSVVISPAFSLSMIVLYITIWPIDTILKFQMLLSVSKIGELLSESTF